MKFTEKWLYKSEDLFVKKIKKILLIEWMKESTSKYEFSILGQSMDEGGERELRGMKKIKLFTGIRFFIFLFGITFKFTSSKIRLS